MAVAPKKIECAICRVPAKGDQMSCTQCGGRVVKICGSCGFELSAAKRYCDSCGDEQLGSHTPLPFDQGHTPLPPLLKKKNLPDSPPPSPQPQKPPPAAGRPGVEARKPAERKARPADEDPAARFRRPSAGQGVPDSSRKTLALSEFKKRREQAKPVFSTLLGIVLLLAGVGVYGWYWMQQRSPGGKLLVTAENYLAALRAGRFEDAHELLSAASRRSCTLERFREVQAKGAWDFSAPVVDSQLEDQAVLVYQVAAAGQPKEQDWLHFIREDGTWRRAYWWHLMEPIEENLASGDAESAFARAQTARQIDPYDPLVASYLCEAAYAQDAFELAERECLNALRLAGKGPSRLGETGVFRLRRILADIYRSELMLASPGLADEQRCAIQLTAAEAQLLAEDWEKALAGFSAASASCRDPEERDYLRRGIRMLSGKGGQDAVLLAQRYHMPGDSASLLEWRRQSSAELARRLKEPTPAYTETWEAAHQAGPRYEVLVRSDGNPVLTAMVDLWTQTVRAKLNVQ